MAYSVLFLWELHGKDNGIACGFLIIAEKCIFLVLANFSIYVKLVLFSVFKMGLYGATAYLFFPEAYGMLYYCLHLIIHLNVQVLDL